MPAAGDARCVASASASSSTRSSGKPVQRVLPSRHLRSSSTLLGSSPQQQRQQQLLATDSQQPSQLANINPATAVALACGALAATPAAYAADGAAAAGAGLAAAPLWQLAVDLQLLDSVPMWAFALGGAALVAAPVVAARLTAYSKLQYVTAALLTNRVPRGGARILQLGGSTKDLYYYPSDAVQVTVVVPGANAGLWEQAGIQAALPVVVRNAAPRPDQRWAPDGSADAVVVPASLPPPLLTPTSSSAAATAGAGVDKAVADATRALKPGGCLLLVQQVVLAGGDSPLRALYGGSAGAVDATALEAALEKVEKMYDSIEVDVVLEGQDPHVVAVARKKSLDSDDVLQQALEAGARQQKAADKKKGFRGAK